MEAVDRDPPVRTLVCSPKGMGIIPDRGQGDGRVADVPNMGLRNHRVPCLVRRLLVPWSPDLGISRRSLQS